MKFGPCFIDERYKMCVKKTLPIPAVVKTSLNFAFLRLAFVFPAQQVLLPRTDCWLPDHLAHLMREYGDRVFNKAPFPFGLNYRQHITVTNGIESRYISTSELHLCLEYKNSRPKSEAKNGGNRRPVPVLFYCFVCAVKTRLQVMYQNFVF